MRSYLLLYHFILLVLQIASANTQDLRILLVGGSGTTYDANFTFGNPPQSINLRIDITEGDLYVLDAGAIPSCDDLIEDSSSSSTVSTLSTVTVSSTLSASSSQSTSSASACGLFGMYNISTSTTSNSLNSTSDSAIDFYDLPYINGIYVSGHMVEDDITFIDTNNIEYNISDFTFLSANESTVDVGGMGLASNNIGTGFLPGLKKNSIIDVDSYSLWLSNISSTYGELLPGIVDSTLFTGDFYEYDMIVLNDESVATIPIVPFSGLSLESKSGDVLSITLTNESFPMPVLLDTRTFYNFIPTDMILALAVQLNAYYSADFGRWLVECSVADLNATINFQFGDLEIKVPVSEILYYAYDDADLNLQFQDGEYACYIAFLPSEDTGVNILGTPFLRSTYIAVDNEGKKIAMGQANHTHTPEPRVHTTTVVYDSTSTSSSSLPSYISKISSGKIPFATANTYNYSLTLTSQSVVSTDYNPSPEQSIFISGGEVFFTSVSGSKTATAASVSASSANSTTTSKSDSNSFKHEFIANVKFRFGGILSCVIFGFLFIGLIL